MKKTKHGHTHIMKSYVDWFEERGVRVVPIPYDTNEHEFYFKNINGLLIPGGETEYILKQQPFIDTVVRFFELSLKRDEYFPIWGTCFGFEMLIYTIAFNCGKEGGNMKFKKYPTHGHFPISITADGFHSKLFGSFSKSYLQYLEEQKSTSENHDFGISPKDFMEHDSLRRFYSILATSRDDNGKEYVAAIEGKYYPVYGVQWHPERQHGVGTPFVDFFISELRKCKHKSRIPFPYLRQYIKPHKCVQYPEHRDLLCYFF